MAIVVLSGDLHGGLPLRDARPQSHKRLSPQVPDFLTNSVGHQPDTNLTPRRRRSYGESSKPTAWWHHLQLAHRTYASESRLLDGVA